MRSVNRIQAIGIALVSGALILFGTLFLPRQKASHYQPEKKFLAPTVLPTLIATPTPTLAPDQIKAIYTFYIQATSRKTSTKGLGLKQSDTGKTFTIDTGTFISLDFGPGKFDVSLSSPQDIFKCVGSECLPHSSPRNSISSFWVSRAGYGTIKVIEAE